MFYIDLYPEIDIPKKIKSRIVVPKDDFFSLQGDWEVIGKDIALFLSESITEE